MPRRARVEQRRRLVEHERVRVGEHEPRERELLRLRGRERRRRRRRRPSRAPSGSASAHSSASTAASASASSRVARVGPREPQVLGERPDEDVLLLRDERDLAAQRLEREVDEADAADLDPARARRVDAREQTAERRLARARRPDDGDALARLEVEVDAVQDVAAVDVRVAHVVGRSRSSSGSLVGRGAVGRDAGRCRRAARTSVAPTWISSSHEISRSTGSASCTT